MKSYFGRFIVSILLFCFLSYLLAKGLRYIVIDDTGSYTRITYHEMYAQKNIDVLFVGSSHCFRSFIPQILDKRLGVNTFNGGSSGQSLDGSYMVIKEAAKNNEIKRVYLDMYYQLSSHVHKSNMIPTSTYIISDYLKPSLDKVIYLYNATSKEHYMNSFIAARRNWEKLYDFEYINELIRKKSTKEYRNYEYRYVTDDQQWYVGKGYVANGGTVKNWNYFSPNGWEPIKIDEISTDWEEDLKRIIDFCEERDIELTLVSAPMSDFILSGHGNYDEYIDYVKKMIAGTDIKYIDFNLCRENVFPMTSEVFYDETHLNYVGAERLSTLFADLVTDTLKEEDVFYSSYDDKMRCMSPRILGVSYNDKEQDVGGVIRNCRVISNREGFMYRIQRTIENGYGHDFRVIQDYSSNDQFEIPIGDRGTITVFGKYENYDMKITVSYGYEE